MSAVPTSDQWSGGHSDSVACPETGGGFEMFQATWGANNSQPYHRSNESHQSEPFNKFIGLRTKAWDVPRVEGKLKLGGKLKIGINSGVEDDNIQTSDTHSTNTCNLPTKDLHRKWWI